MIEKIEFGVAAIDIGQEWLFVAVANEKVRRFGTFTSELKLLGQYLGDHGVRRVAMEATGVYWIPVHDSLEAGGFEVTLFNGQQARNLPGRKSDVSDCQWHAMLHGHGLLHPCFVPPEEIRQLRSFYRLRDDHISMAATHIQHMQKALDLMNVRLHTVISQIHGVSGLRIIKAILAGQRKPETLAALCDNQILNRKRTEVVKSLEGVWQEHHLFALRQALEGYEFYQRQILSCDQEIAKLLKVLTRDKQPPSTPPGAKIKVVRHNAPAIKDLREQLIMLADGRDPTQISGISPLSFLKLLGETGTDLSRWPTKQQFTSYLKLSPGQHSSGKMRRNNVRRGNTKGGQIFREAALSVTRSKHLALGAFYRRIKGRRGHQVAIKAVARKLAEYYYDVMTKGWHHVEIGIQRYEDNHLRQIQRYVNKMAATLGMQLIPVASPTSA